MRKPAKLTVGKLRKMLEEFDDEQVIEFSSDIRVESMRYIGGGRVYAKVAQHSAILGPRFKAAYPEVEAVLFWPTKKSPSPIGTEYLRFE